MSSKCRECGIKLKYYQINRPAFIWTKRGVMEAQFVVHMCNICYDKYKEKYR